LALMVHLSVNVNKIAFLRNARNLDLPSVLWACETIIEAGAQGITVHPRPDERHIRPGDVTEIADLLKNHPGIEYNIEGNPLLPPFMELVRKVKPDQCTLVPDNPEAFTSDHGWSITPENRKLLDPILKEIHDLGARVSLFMDPDPAEIEKAGETGAERIELYTEPYAQAYGGPEGEAVFQKYAQAAAKAKEVGLELNAGHDLNLENLGKFATIPNLKEVSIGHALTADALRLGLAGAVGEYLRVLREAG